MIKLLQSDCCDALHLFVALNDTYKFVENRLGRVGLLTVLKCKTVFATRKVRGLFAERTMVTL